MRCMSLSIMLLVRWELGKSYAIEKEGKLFRNFAILSIIIDGISDFFAHS